MEFQKFAQPRKIDPRMLGPLRTVRYKHDTYSWETCDCYTFICLAYMHLAGIQIPTYRGPGYPESNIDREAVEAVFEDKRQEWLDVQRKDLLPLDIVVFTGGHGCGFMTSNHQFMALMESGEVREGSVRAALWSKIAWKFHRYPGFA